MGECLLRGEVPCVGSTPCRPWKKLDKFHDMQDGDEIEHQGSSTRESRYLCFCLSYRLSEYLLLPLLTFTLLAASSCHVPPPHQWLATRISDQKLEAIVGPHCHQLSITASIWPTAGDGGSKQHGSLLHSRRLELQRRQSNGSSAQGTPIRAPLAPYQSIERLTRAWKKVTGRLPRH